MNPKGKRNIPASIAFVLSQRPASIASVKLANRGTPLTPQGRTSIHPYDCPSSFLFASLRPALQAGQACPHLRKSTRRRRCRCPRSEPRAAAHAGSLPDQEQAQPMPERLQSIQGTQEARSGHRRPQSGPELPPVSLPGSVAGRAQDERQRAR